MTTTLDRTVLSLRDHEHFLEHGYVILERVVPPDLVEAALRRLEAPIPDVEPGSATYGAAAVQGSELDACITPTIRAAVAELLGDAYPYERPGRAYDMPRQHTPEAEWALGPPHVDDDYPSLMPNVWTLGLFVFLTPLRHRGGAFLLVPGSPHDYRPLLAANVQAHSLVFTLADDFVARRIEFLAQPGDALLFHHMLAHSGSNNVADPTTRHALLTRFHPTPRLVPGAKPFDEMSTIEKANSARYLAERAGQPLPPAPPLELGVEAVAHAAFRRNGDTHVLFVDPSDPSVVRRNDGGTCLELPGRRIRSLSTHQERFETILLVDDGTETHVAVSSDLQSWRVASVLPGTRAATVFHTTEFGSNIARGSVIAYVPADDPGSVRAVWSGWDEPWERLASWPGSAQLAALGRTVHDVHIESTLAENEYALVVDADDGPHYALSSDCAVFDEPLRPLAFSSPTAPRQIRVYARARRYWLVTYRLEGRVAWGAIDWEETPVALEPISEAAALERPLETIGLR